LPQAHAGTPVNKHTHQLEKAGNHKSAKTHAGKTLRPATSKREKASMQGISEEKTSVTYVQKQRQC